MSALRVLSFAPLLRSIGVRWDTRPPLGAVCDARSVHRSAQPIRCNRHATRPSAGGSAGEP